jgi:peptidoglycan/LPS O-acetylase OafA/YrhL
MSQNRLSELDGLRGLAALSVVFFHYFYKYGQIYSHSFEVPEVFKFGSHGLRLFFMMSGFAIYWTISRTEKPLDFIWSRITRLYPVFWCAVLLTFAVVAMFGLQGREHGLSTLIANLTMMHEYLGYSHIDGAYWTLSLELAFYFWILLIYPPVSG